MIENQEEEDEEETAQEQPPAHTSGSTLESHDTIVFTAPVPSAPPIPTLEVAMVTTIIMLFKKKIFNTSLRNVPQGKPL